MTQSLNTGEKEEDRTFLTGAKVEENLRYQTIDDSQYDCAENI